MSIPPLIPFSAVSLGSSPLTVVIPTLDRPDPLRDVLGDLDAQTDPNFETLVIDQSGRPDAELAARAADSAGRLRYVHLFRRSLPYARNVALALARGWAVIYLDDDVRFGPDLVAAHRRALLMPGVGAVAGRITGGYESTVGTSGAPGRIFRMWPKYVRNFHGVKAALVEHLPGGHHSVRVDLLAEAGGYDERFSGRAGICEESDMAHRLGRVLRNHGLRMVFDPRASLEHLHLPTGGCREEDVARGVYWHAHNVMLLFLRYYSRANLPAYLLWTAFRGARLALAHGQPDLLAYTARGTLHACRSFRVSGRRPRNTALRAHNREGASHNREGAESLSSGTHAGSPFAGGSPVARQSSDVTALDPRAPRRLRVLVATDYFRPGEGRVYLDGARCFQTWGHETHFLASTPPDGPRTGDVLDGVRMCMFPYPDRARPLRFIRHMRQSFQQRFERMLTGGAFDVIMLHGPLAGFGLRAARTLPPPVIYNFHSPWADEHEAKTSAPGVLGKSFLRLGAGVRNAIENRALARAWRVTTLSEFMHERLRARHPRLAPARWRLVPGWADTRRFNTALSRAEARRRLGIAHGDGPLLVSIRRMEQRMGLDALLDAFPTILRRRPGARLIIGGKGPLEDALRRHAARLGIGERVRFWGYVAEDDIANLYRAADLFVLPTRALEGFGLVTVEALACGTPVVGTPVGGTREILTGLDPALLSASTSARDIAGATLRAMDGGWLSPAASRRCRDFVLERYTFQRGARDYNALAFEALGETLREVAGQAPPGGRPFHARGSSRKRGAFHSTDRHGHRA